MRLYQNSTDTVIAESVEDAKAVWCEHTGEKEYDYSDDPFVVVPDDKVLKVKYEDAPDDAEDTVKQTAAEWARVEGRTFLCSTEF